MCKDFMAKSEERRVYRYLPDCVKESSGRETGEPTVPRIRHELQSVSQDNKFSQRRGAFRSTCPALPNPKSMSGLRYDSVRMRSLVQPGGHGRTSRPRPVRSLVHTAIACVMIGSAVGPTCTTLVAQTDLAPQRTSRTKIFTIAGAVLGSLAGLVVRSGGASKGGHGCLGVPCVVIGATAIGAGIGFAIGHESDRTYNSRFRGVVPLRLSSVNADLEGDPVALTAGDDLVAVGGSIGVELFQESGPMTGASLRARGLNGIMVVALARPSGWLAVGSPSGLYMFPPATGAGALVRPGDVAAIVGGTGHVYVGVDDRIEIAPLADDTSRTWPGITVTSPVHALGIDSARSLLWATTDRDLIAYRMDGDSLVRVGAAPLESVGLRLAQSGDTIAVALGERGVRVFDVSDPAAPRVVASWTIAHFAYDVAISKQRLFVAAGPEGVYVLDLSTSPIHTIGLARGMGFATALASRGGYTYILDRRNVVLRRILSDF